MLGGPEKDARVRGGGRPTDQMPALRSRNENRNA
jgi:hypothetical protein